MKLDGSYVIEHATREEVFEALQKPDVLARTLPGCRELEEIGKDVYQMTLDAGVGGLRGTYLATVRLVESDAPERHVLEVDGRGTPGTIHGQVLARLSSRDGGTLITYEADATVGGPAAGVGQRVLAAAAERLATDFLGALGRELREPPAQGEDTGRPAVASSEGARGPAQAAPVTATGGRIYQGQPRSVDLQLFVMGWFLGFVSAVIGVLVGRAVARSG
jgi:carbon monoxide dehydrogenase subunit G